MTFPFMDIDLVNLVTNTPIRRRPRPFVPLRVAGPNGRLFLLDALVDSGADEVLIPQTLLAGLGFAPGSGITRGTSGVGGRTATVYQRVRLELRTAPNDRLVWNTTVAFGHVPFNIVLFGIAGGLEFFHTTLNVIDRQVTLYPHPMMPLSPASVTPHVAFPIP